MTKNIPVSIIALFFYIWSAGVSVAATVRVPGDLPSIQAAVDSAAPGDSIALGGGTYVENVVIKKTLTLKPVDPGDPAVITASDLNKPTVSVIDTKDVTITGLVVTGSEIAGLMLLNADTSTIEGNTFTDNAKGMMILSSTGNSITENEIDENGQYGIYLSKSGFNTITGNSVDENGDKGIFLSDSSNNAIVGNHANLNMWNGVVLWSSNYNLVTGNKTLRNTYGIVESESQGNVITNNSVWPNIFIILPVLLIYAGILTYLIQKRVLRMVYGV